MNSRDANSEAADRFGLIAQRFCSLVDSAITMGKTEFSVELYRILPDLIAEAIRLPEVELHEMDSNQESNTRKLRAKAAMRDDDWRKLYNSLTEKLGDWNLYWQVFDPTKDDEAIHGSLADDVADIYRDLKPGIYLKGIDQASFRDIIWEWRFGFHSHWGKHAIDALRIFHFLLAETLE
ncbi:MAG: DUF5063 domain-containing protein [Candidatus Acidiferrum sp.]